MKKTLFAVALWLIPVLALAGPPCGSEQSTPGYLCGGLSPNGFVSMAPMTGLEISPVLSAPLSLTSGGLSVTVNTSTFGLLAANNNFTGINQFSNSAGLSISATLSAKSLVIAGTTETFPASGLVVGTTDTQTLTNKSIVASEINSGTLAAARGGTGVSNTTSLTWSGTATTLVFASGFPTYTFPLITDTLAGLGSVQNYTATQRSAPVTITVSTVTFTPDGSTGNNWSLTLNTSACSCTLANPTNVEVGASGIIQVIQPASGGPSTITTWGSDYKFAGGIKPTLSTANNAVDTLSYTVIDATHIEIQTFGLAFQ